MKKTVVLVSLMAAAQAFAGFANGTFYINNSTNDNTAEGHETVYAQFAGNATYEIFSLKAGKNLNLVPGDAHATTIQTMTLNENSGLIFGTHSGSKSGKSYLTALKLESLTMNSGSAMTINTATTVRIDSLTQGENAQIKVGDNATVLVKVTPGGAWNDLSKISLTGTNARKGYTVSGSFGDNGLLLEAATGNVIELSGATGILGGSGETVVTKDVILTNPGSAAAEFTTIQGDSYTFNGAISGNGNFIFGQADKDVTVTLNGDLSGWSTSNDQWGGFRNSAGKVTVNMNDEGTVNAAFNVHTLHIGADATLNKYIAVTNFSVAAGKTVSTTQHFAADSVTLADGAHLTLDTSAPTRTIQALTLGAGADVTLNYNDSHAGKTLVTSSLTLTGNSAINANLTVSDGGEMDFSSGAVLTMGCSVEIGDNVTVKIDESIIEGIISGGQTVAIITNAEAITSLDNKTWHFRNADGDSLDWANLRLEVGKDGTSIVVAPEPATATLSLLALAAFCARRKRQGT